MSTDLQQFSDFLASMNPVQSVALADDLMPASEYLPYLSLVQAGSGLKRPPYNCGEGHLVLRRNKTDVKDLGASLDCIVINWRPMAMDCAGPRPISTTNSNSDMFKDIIARSKQRNSNCFWGFELLVLIGDTGEYATFFCNNKSLQYFARNQIIGTEEVPGLIRKPITITSEYKDGITPEGQKTQYLILNAVECTTPFSSTTNFNRLGEIEQEFLRGRTSDVSSPEEAVEAATDSTVR